MAEIDVIVSDVAAAVTAAEARVASLALEAADSALKLIQDA